MKTLSLIIAALLCSTAQASEAALLEILAAVAKSESTPAASDEHAAPASKPTEVALPAEVTLEHLAELQELVEIGLADDLTEAAKIWDYLIDERILRSQSTIAEFPEKNSEVAPKAPPKTAVSVPPVDRPQSAEITRLQSHTQQYTTREVTRYRTVRKKFCNGRSCYYRMVKEPYTVTERVPVSNQFTDAGKKVAPKKSAYYPQRPVTWTLNGRWVSAEHLYKHWAHDQDGIDPAWAHSLDSREVQSAHQDMHNHRIDWRYAKHK